MTKHEGRRPPDRLHGELSQLMVKKYPQIIF